MEQTYWLGRKRASAANARSAGSAEARLAHLELAGRYSVKAAASAEAGGPAPPRLALRQAEPDRSGPDAALPARAVWLALGAGGRGGDGG